MNTNGLAAAIVLLGALVAPPTDAALPAPPPPTKDSLILIRSGYDAEGWKTHSNLYLVNARNNKAHKLTGGNGTVVFDSGPDWAPNGRYIAFSRKTPRADNPRYQGDADLYLLNLRSMRETRLTFSDPDSSSLRDAHLPTWSRQGRLAFTALQPQRGYCVFVFTDLRRRETKNLFCFRDWETEEYWGPGPALQLDWTKDGRSLIATSFGVVGDLREFWAMRTFRIDVASGRVEQLAETYDYSDADTLNLSPSRKEGYYSGRSSDWVSLVTGQIIEERTDGSRAVYSTSGKWIALTDDSAPNDPPGPYYHDVFLATSDGVRQARLSDFRLDNVSIEAKDWSVDDSRLLVNVTQFDEALGIDLTQAYLLDTRGNLPMPEHQLPEGEATARSWFKRGK